jgi:hypothetical protein
MKGMHFKSEIAQRELSDFWRGIHAWRKTSFLHIRLSIVRELIWSWRNPKDFVRAFTLCGEGGSPPHGEYNSK